MTDPNWSNAITDYDPAVDPSELLAHPLNARQHPTHQRSALRGSLDRVGWVDTVKVNVRTGRIVDGHARVEEALESGATVPVLWVDLSDDDERFVLATLDPISALATYDHEILAELVDGLEIEAPAVDAMLADLMGEYGGPPPPPDLDDLDDEHDGDTFWPVIRVKVPPDAYERWKAAVSDADGDEAVAMLRLLGS